MEEARFSGVVRASGARVMRVAVEKDGKELAAHFAGGTFELMVDGNAIVVDATSGALRLLGPSERRKAAWSELRDDPLASEIPRNIAPAYDEVELVTQAIEDNSAIEVHGVVSERAQEGGTHRSAPTSRVSNVQARIIAIGPRATSLMNEALAPPKVEVDEAVKRDPGDEPVRAVAFVPFGIIFLIFAGLGANAYYHQDAVNIIRAIAVLAIALTLRPRRYVPDFRAREKPLMVARYGVILVSRMMISLATMWLAMGVIDSDVKVGNTLALILGLVTTFGFAMTVILQDFHPTQMLSRLLGSDRITGKVIDPTPVTIEGGEAAIGASTEWKKGFGSDPDIMEGSKLSVRGTFAIEDGTRRVWIDPDEIIWATTIRKDPENPSHDYTTQEWIPVGGNALARGKVVPFGNDFKLLAKGTMPAIVFATGPTGDPVRFARRILGHRMLSLLLLMFASVAIVAAYQRF